MKNDGDPYVVYTPYMKTWKEKFKTIDLEIFYTNEYLNNLIEHTRLPNLSLSDKYSILSLIFFTPYSFA